MIVLKFGGQTISTPERINTCLDIIEHERKKKPVVVVSAHGGTTAELRLAAEKALTGDIKTGRIRQYHLQLAAEMGISNSVIEPLLSGLEALLHGIGLLKELTPRTLDNALSFGERLAARIIAASLHTRGLGAVPLNAYDIGLLTDSSFGNARPLPESEKNLFKNLLKESAIPVVTGFIGKDKDGEITTLGKSGSDFSATIIAGAVGAEEVVIWKAVDGIMTADPDIDKRAKNIPEISFDEASELAYFGAEVLHPSTLTPAIRKNIPVRVANTLRKNDKGTLILSRPVITKKIAKSVAYKEDVALIHLNSPRLHAVPELLKSALEILKGEGIVAHMITTSEAGISLITQSGLSAARLEKSKKHLSPIADVTCKPSMAIICMVGDELKGRPDSIGRIFESLSHANVNPLAISRSASEINVAFLVKNSDVKSAIKALHSLII